jgi:hypothetical protein
VAYDTLVLERDGPVARVWLNRPGQLAAEAVWASRMSKSQFRAYGRSTVRGDVAEMDGDLFAAASREDPWRLCG